MILKALTRKAGSGQLVRYILRYAINPQKQLDKTKNDKKYQVVENAFIIRHNIRSNSIEGFIKEFKQNELNRIHKRSNQTVLNHFIISFSPDDTKNLTDKKLRTIAKKFICLYGENNLFIGSKHLDKEHVHLHIACSGTQINGRSSRISKAAMAELKVELDLFQKQRFPELVSLPHHGLSKSLKMDFRAIEGVGRHLGKNTQKEQLIKSLEQHYAKANSLVGFLNGLRSVGYEPYYRSGRLTGVKSEGRKFRLNRLGYDEQKIVGLGQQNLKADKELTTLRAIRKRSQKLELTKDSHQHDRVRELSCEKDGSNVMGRMEQNEVLPMTSPFKNEGIGILPSRSISPFSGVSPG